MSGSSIFAPPPRARAVTLPTRRGPFAALDAHPADAVRGTVLMLPGFMGSKEGFSPLLEPLTAAGYRVLCVDGLGQYETDGPDTEYAYSQDELAEDVLAQAEAAGVALHLVGHSMGGQVARAAVLLDRNPFLSLTLMCSGPAEINQAQRSRVKLLSDVLVSLSMDEVWAAMRELEPLNGPAADIEFMRNRWLRNNPKQLLVTGRQLTIEPDRVAELAAVESLPVHVLSGEQDDMWGVAEFDDLAARLSARRTVIKGAAHRPNLEKPAETAAALSAFWDGLHPHP